ncbi:MAG: hypothetical protein OEM01_00210 [Desulfobulbaceae bacterium]|nr:hypothetical protein [Desulfobulbaceae bacterium]
MQCTQLIRLIKDWYLNVKEETMAPARMMQFTDKHIKNCEICLQDAGLMEEVEKIREFVLPEAKIPKSERDDEDEPTPEISPDEENGDDNDDEFNDDDDDDSDIDDED